MKKKQRTVPYIPISESSPSVDANVKEASVSSTMPTGSVTTLSEICETQLNESLKQSTDSDNSNHSNLQENKQTHKQNLTSEQLQQLNMENNHCESVML